ncbi:MAG: cell division protein ZapA [Alphaproteobacteria bacterium]
MPMVEITVNGRRHSVHCGEGEEARVRGLAQYIDRKVAELAVDGTKIGDARLMLLASLMVADELSDAYDKIQELEAAKNGGSAPAASSAEHERQAAALIEQVADQLNAVAAELERA